MIDDGISGIVAYELLYFVVASLAQSSIGEDIVEDALAEVALELRTVGEVVGKARCLVAHLLRATHHVGNLCLHALGIFGVADTCLVHKFLKSFELFLERFHLSCVLLLEVLRTILQELVSDVCYFFL